VVVAEPGREEEAAMRLGRIGFDHVAGYLDGGMQALESHPDLVRRLDRITAPMLAEQLAAMHPVAVLDVRTPQEWQAKRIEGSVNIPLQQLQQRLHDVPRDRLVVVHCASGYRSSIAASVLARHGVKQLVDLVGGFAAWEASQLPTVTPAAVPVCVR
jgi:hydroxyacylglutathione hydrolase